MMGQIKETMENWIDTLRVIRNFVKTKRTEEQIAEFLNHLMGQNQSTLVNQIELMVHGARPANDR